MMYYSPLSSHRTLTVTVWTITALLLNSSIHHSTTAFSLNRPTPTTPSQHSSALLGVSSSLFENIHNVAGKVRQMSNNRQHYCGVLLSALKAQEEADADAELDKEDDRPRILSFGNACVDLLAICDEFPEPDKKMNSKRLLLEGGGNAANTACALGRLSDYVSSHVVTAIGRDDYGDRIVQDLKENHVGVENVERFLDDDATSPFSYIIVTPDNARTIIHQPALYEMSVDFADKIDISHYTAVHFDGRHPQAALHLSKRLVQANIPYSVDVERPRGSGHEELLENASFIICSSDYCNKVLGPPPPQTTNQDYVDRLRQVTRLQTPNAVLAMQTVGSKGSYLIRLRSSGDTTDNDTSPQERTILEQDTDSCAPAVTYHSGALWCSTWGGIDIVDSTGAGDAFQGGFIAGLWTYMKAHGLVESSPSSSSSSVEKLESIPDEALAHAMRIGTRVAAKKLECLGARKGLPYVTDDIPLQTEFQDLLAVPSKVRPVSKQHHTP